MRNHAPRSTPRNLSAKLHSLMLALPLLAGPAVFAQSTWLTNGAGNTTWSTAVWDPAVPSSGATTVLNFFSNSTTVFAGTNIAYNDLTPNPFVVNQLNISGVGGASACALTIQGNGIAFDGVAPQLNINPAYGSGGGYTFNLAAPLTFNAPTTITYGGGGGLINTTSASTWNGSGNVTFTSALAARPLSLSGAPGTYTGDLILSGNTTVLQLNGVTNTLGTNTATTQAVIVGAGSGVNINYNNAAFTNAQNFILNGTGNAGTAGAALNVTRVAFGSGPVGGLAIASPSTVRIQMESAADTRGITLTRGLVGTADLTKTGTGYLLTNALGGNVTWGGNAYSLYSGNITVNEGVVQTPANIPNTLGTNLSPGNPQSVVVNSGGAVVLGAANNAAANPQNFVLNGSGTGYVANNGGLVALTTGAVGFGSNSVGSIVVQGDASVGTLRTAAAGNIGLNLSRGLLGSGTLTINNAHGANFGTVFVNVASPASQVTSAGTFTSFTGKVVINNGLLSINNASSLGAVSTGQVYLSGVGTFASAIAGGLNQAFLDRVSNAATSTGAIALGAASANDLDFTGYPGLRLGASASSTYSGNLTAGTGGYRLGGGGGTLTVSSALTGDSPLSVGGAVTLTSANNTFTGGITIAGANTGTDHVARLNFTNNGTNVLPSANTLTFAGVGGTFAYATPVNTTETSQALGNLTFSEGFGSVTATTGNATVFGNSTLTFAGLSRTAGAAGTLQTTNGTNGTSNKLVVTGLAPGFVNKGVFYNTGNYAFNDAAGFLRAPVYGTDAGFVTSGTTGTVGSATHQQITGSLTAQNTATFTTLRISGNISVALAPSQTLTVEGILKAGGGTLGGISGGTGIQAGSGSELVINTADALAISTPVLNNANTSLTKVGAGTLTLSAAGNTYAGGTTVAQGTLVVASTATGGLADAAPVVVNGGTYNSNVADTIGALTLRHGTIGGLAAISPSSATLQNGAVNTVLAGSTSVTKSTEGYVYLSANNTYSGGTTISAGSLGLVGQGTFGTGLLTISGGRVDLGGKTITNILGPITGGGSLHRGTVVNNGGTYELQDGTITAALSGTNGLNKTTAGSLTLTGNNTYTGPTTITEGSLVLGASALPGGGLGVSKVVLSTGTSLDISSLTAPTVSLAGGLGGNGTVNAGDKTLTIAGTFTPGALSVTGNLTFDPATLTTFVASGSPATTTAVVVTGSVTNSGNLTIDPAPSFTFSANQSFTFVSASGGITPGYSGVTANSVTLAESPDDVWSATADGLIYTYTETTATLTVASAVVYSPLQLWRFEKFSTYDNTGSAADTFDADGDGMANLLEYALNGNPNLADTSILPQITGTGPLKLSFYRNGDANITYIVEARDDLVSGTWSEIYNSFGTTYTPGMFEVTDFGQVGTKRFMRLRVTAP